MTRTLQVFLRQHLVVTKELIASRLQDASASLNCAEFSITRMPLPPPPAKAFSSTG
jgi:hypothetical protein